MTWYKLIIFIETLNALQLGRVRCSWKIVHGLMNKGSFESVIFMTPFCSKQFTFLCLVKFDLFKNLTSQKSHCILWIPFFTSFFMCLGLFFHCVPKTIFHIVQNPCDLKKYWITVQHINDPNNSFTKSQTCWLKQRVLWGLSD